MTSPTPPTICEPAPRTRCACGCGESIETHCGDPVGPTSHDDKGSDGHSIDRIVETTVLRAILPDPMLRRTFLKAVGASVALSAIAEVFPLAAGKAIAQQAAGLERPSSRSASSPLHARFRFFLPTPWANTRRKDWR
jgi:nitrate/nitrite transport system substrate-binding protein